MNKLKKLYDNIYSALLARKFINDHISFNDHVIKKELASWKKKLNFSNPASNDDEDTCSSCFDSTKYVCLSCKFPFCEECTTFQDKLSTETVIDSVER